MDPIQLIRHDHQLLERLFRRLEQALSSERPAATAEALRDVTRELSIHAAIEEQFLYPALRDSGADGAVLFAVEEHHAAKLTLVELQITPPSDPRFATKARLLMRNVREHIAEEERELLPSLERRVSPDELRELGAALANAKLLSPTRPHPGAPEQPPGNLVAGPVVGVLDRARDAVRDGALGLRSVTESAVEAAMIVLRRLSNQAQRQGREAVDDLAARTGALASEARHAGRRTLEEAAGRSAEAARQLRAPARQRHGRSRRTHRTAARRPRRAA